MNFVLISISIAKIGPVQNDLDVAVGVPCQPTLRQALVRLL
jgi:hypothetical protein